VEVALDKNKTSVIRRFFVEVGGSEHLVVISQQSAESWLAVGTYAGEKIEVSAGSEEDARTRWQTTARAKA
jgi:hypothetical protein